MKSSRFNMAHGFVAEISDQPAAEAQGLGYRCGLLALKPFAEIGVGIGLVQALDAHVSAAGVTHDTPHRRAARRGDSHYSLAARETDERIAPEALAAHDRLEKIRVGPVRELGVQRQRGVQIGARLGEHWNAGVALRGELLKFELRHETLSNFCTRGELPCGLGGARPRAARGRDWV